MQANLENLGTLERKLSVALPAADIDNEVENRLKRLSRTVKMHGFRPGKVPFKVVVQQYGPQVRQEVLGDAMQKSFGEAVDDGDGLAQGRRQQERSHREVLIMADRHLRIYYVVFVGFSARRWRNW